MWEKQALAIWERLVRLLRKRDDDWSVLGHRVHMRGEITSGGHLEIRGRVEGDIDHTGRLTVARGGRCVSNIHADELQIAGEVHGNVQAEDLLELLPTGRIYGDTACGLLRVHPGGVILGLMQITGAVVPEPVMLPPRPEPARAFAGPLAVLAEPVSGSERAGLLHPRRAEPVIAGAAMVAPEPMGAAPASAFDQSPAFYGGFDPTAGHAVEGKAD